MHPYDLRVKAHEDCENMSRFQQMLMTFMKNGTRQQFIFYKALRSFIIYEVNYLKTATSAQSCVEQRCE